MTQQEFEENIAHLGWQDKECNQIWNIYQAIPFYQGTAAFLPVKTGVKEAAKMFWKSLNPGIYEFIHLIDGKGKLTLGDKYSFLKETHYYFHLYLDGDKTFIGYHNIYRTLNSIASFCEDVKFFLKDLNHCWADEYTISNGIFSFCRHALMDEHYTALLSLFEQRALENPSLRLFSAFAYFDKVKASINQMKNDYINYQTKLDDADLLEMKEFFDKSMRLYEER